MFAVADVVPTYEQAALNPFDEHLLATLKTLFDLTREAVPTTVLAGFAGGYSERTVRHYLSTRLERAGLVARKGQRGGWYPAAGKPAAARAYLN